MATTHHVYHWKHGWIPLDHTAALSKAKGNHSLASKYLEATHSPDVGINSRRDVAGAMLDLPNIPNPADRPHARDQIKAAATKHGADDLIASRTTYRERRQAKAERLREWADKREVKAETAQRRSDQISDMIPMGQPIIVGHYSEGRHRRDLNRMHSNQQSAWDNSKKANEFRNRADNIEAAADKAIYSDDHDAVSQIEKRVADLEAQRDRIKAYNKTVKAGKPDTSILDAEQRRELLSALRHMPFSAPGGKYPDYGLSNLSGNISRNRKRLEQLRKR